MPRSRGTEIPQRPSPRAGPPSVRTSSSDSDSLNHHSRPRTDKSPKLSNGRSPRTSQPDQTNQKKLGNRIADLESQLGQAQNELKCLKSQLASSEAMGKAAQEKVDEKPEKQLEKSPDPVEIQEKLYPLAIENQEPVNGCMETSSGPVQQEINVYEVPVENVAMELEPKIELDQPANQETELKPKPKNTLPDELASKVDELNTLKAKLDERDKELEILRRENENSKKQLHEKSLKTSWAESEIEELTSRVSKLAKELETSKTGAASVAEKLEAVEKGKAELEHEMKRLHVQTEQWRKAADAAANILAGESPETCGRRISERCGSMDKQHYGNGFETASGGVGRYAGFVGSPRLVDENDEDFGGKRKGPSGLRMFVGDLWKKKGHK